MKSLLLAIIIALTLPNLSAYAEGSLKIKPKKPLIGKSVTLTYSPDKKLAGSKKLYAIFHSFSNTSTKPEARQTLLKYNKKKKTYTAKVALKKNEVFGFFSISDGKNIDNNNKQFWDVVVYAKKGKPARNAFARNAIVHLGNLPDRANRQLNVAEATKLMGKELKYYPDNTPAAIGYVSLKGETNKASQEEFTAVIDSILKNPFDKADGNTIRSISQALNILARKTEAEKLTNDYVKQYPQSELAMERSIQEVQSARTAEEFLKKTLVHLQSFPNSMFASSLHETMSQAYLQLKTLDKAETQFSQLPYVSPEAYNIIAWTLVEQKGDSAMALKFAEKAMKEARNPSQKLRPSYIPPIEWEKSNVKSLGLVLDSYGAALAQLGKKKEAAKAYSEAMSTASDVADASMYERALRSFSGQKSDKEMYQLASNAISVAKTTPYILKQHKKLYSAVHGHAEKFEYSQALKKLEAKAEVARRKERIASRLNLPAIQGTFSTMDGKPVRLADLKGKVVMIDFWATWCGPCKKSFPAMQEMYEEYKNNKDVQFLIVNVWERSEDRKKAVQGFMKKHPTYSFDVFFDLKDEVVGKFGVTGIPTKFYLDRNGKVQYKEVGYKPPSEFKREMRETIETLLSKEFYDG
jgi:thiol-disulfide isomerase/thioredoxin